MFNAGVLNRKIRIYSVQQVTDSAGFQTVSRTLVLTTYASVKTTRGMTIIKNNSDFEKAYTKFLIRYPLVAINRDMEIDFRGKTYTIEYLANVDESETFLEIQAKEVTH